MLNKAVIPAKAGIQMARSAITGRDKDWIPAFAGMTIRTH